MYHSRSWKKHRDWTRAIKNRKVAKDIFPFYDEYPELHKLHQYSKNKFHCVWTYSPKTKQAGIYNYKASDMRKIHKLSYSEKEYNLVP